MANQVDMRVTVIGNQKYAEYWKNIVYYLRLYPDRDKDGRLEEYATIRFHEAWDKTVKIEPAPKNT